LTVLLKVASKLKSTVAGKLFHTFTNLFAKKFATEKGIKRVGEE